MMRKTVLRQVQHGGDDYQRTLDMRFAILRAPLGLDWSGEDLAAEADQLHFALFDDDDDLIACVVVKPLGPDAAKVRQMAVDESFRAMGNGRFLLEGVEAILHHRGIRHIQMDARDIAVRFYEKLGYTIEGAQFTQVTVPHFRMVKDI